MAAARRSTQGKASTGLSFICCCAVAIELSVVDCCILCFILLVELYCILLASLSWFWLMQLARGVRSIVSGLAAVHPKDVLDHLLLL